MVKARKDRRRRPRLSSFLSVRINLFDMVIRIPGATGIDLIAWIVCGEVDRGRRSAREDELVGWVAWAFVGLKHVIGEAVLLGDVKVLHHNLIIVRGANVGLLRVRWSHDLHTVAGGAARSGR